MTDHPITPPPELVREWCAHSNEHENYDQFWSHIATQASRWGSDQELEACCEWLVGDRLSVTASRLRTARRPKPPSLKEQALQAAQRFYAKGHEDCTDEEIKEDFDTIRRALEALDD